MRLYFPLVLAAGLSILAASAPAQSPAPTATPNASASPSPSPTKHQRHKKADAAATPTTTPTESPTASPTPAKKTKEERQANRKANMDRLAAMTPAPGGGPGMVWVNTSSKAYHNSDSPYYGKTKHGKYMTEEAAKAEGDHPDKQESGQHATKPQ